MRHHRPVVVLTLLVLFATTAAAQTGYGGRQVLPGSRVRVRTVDAKTTIGRVVELRGDTLRMTPDRATQTITVPVPQISALDVSVGRHKRRWSGAGLGFAAGFVLGAGVGAATYKRDDCRYADFCDVYGPWPNVVAGAVLAGTAGAITGAVLGNGTADTWALVIGTVQTGSMPPLRRGRVGLGASLRF